MKGYYLKLIALVSIVMILIVVFLGCSGHPTSPSTTQTTSLTSTQSPSVMNPSTGSSVSGKQITAFAGSSSKAALDAASKAFEEKTGIKVFLTYGGSGTMLSQMELSKTGDLFIPASPDYIVKATADNVIFPDTEVKLYYLVPAILVQKGNPRNITSLAELAQSGLQIAIADPQTVPAGRYAYEILDFNNLLSSVGNNVVVYGDSNEKISSYVMLKSVDAAIAWDNLAIQQPDKLDVIYLQPNQVPRISYLSGAVATYTKDKDSAQSFLKYLTSSEGQQFFKKFGYYTDESEAKKFAPNAQIGGIYNLPADYQSLVK